MKDFQLISKLYFIWILIILGLFYFGIRFVFPSLESNFLMQFANWDGYHYLPIAEFGYYRIQEYAFFPLYPLLIKITSFITGSLLLSGILINIISTFFGLVFFYKLVILEKNITIALIAVLLLLVFPTSFFFITVYSESLFFLFTVLSFYFLKKERLFLSVLFSGIATATRPLGLAVAVAVFYQLIVLKKKKNSKLNWSHLMGLSVISVFGLIFYMIFLFIQTGNPLTFLTVQSNWNRSIGWPWDGVLLNLLNIVSSPNIFYQSLAVVWEFLFFVFGFGIVLRSFRYLPTHYTLYGLISLLLPLTTSSLMSFPRFLLPIFPLFIVLALTKNRLILLIYGILSSTLLIYFTILFINGFWVS
jgi:Gpi18-like mannosyltransferase